jgi:hypothetical protein
LGQVIVMDVLRYRAHHPDCLADDNWRGDRRTRFIARLVGAIIPSFISQITYKSVIDFSNEIAVVDLSNPQMPQGVLHVRKINEML